MIFIHNRNFVNSIFMKDGHGFAGEGLRLHGGGVFRHDFGDRRLGELVAFLFEAAAQIAVGEQPAELALVINQQHAAMPLLGVFLGGE